MKRLFMVVAVLAVVATAAAMPGSGMGSARIAPRSVHGEAAFGLARAAAPRLDAATRKAAAGFKFVDFPEFGGRIAVSADGTTALVSATGVHAGRGAVYVYHASGAGSWASTSTPTATLTSSAIGPQEEFGRGLALSADGTTAFIGAPHHEGGTVSVYHVASEDAWTSASSPTATLSANHGYSVGFSIGASADGTTVVVGAPDTNTYAGGAFVFHVASEDAWISTSVPTAVLSNAAEPEADEGVGGVVALSSDGTTALVSDSYASHGAGAGYVWHVASESTWTTSSTPTAILSNASAFAEDALGGSLSLSGDGTTAFLAAPGANQNAGAVDVFHVADEADWATTGAPTAILASAAGHIGDQFGSFARASADGTTLVATAPYVAKRRGAAFLFHVADEGSWVSTATPTVVLTDSARQPSDYLGEGVAVSGDGATVFAGAPGVNWLTGIADVFHASDASSWATTATPTATLTNAALPKPVCIVPRLVGLPLAFARFVISGYTDCRLGKVKKVKSTTKKGRIVAQSPAANKKIAPGSKISLTVNR
jgi:hypothetical protein